MPNNWRTLLQTVQVIDDCSEITYNIAAEAAGGLVSARDFVTLRRWMPYKDSIYLSCNIGIIHSDMPVTKKYVRYVNGWCI